LRNGYEVKTPATVLDEYSDLYLSKLHLDNPQVGCPIASLASELAKEEETYKTVFSHGFKELIQTLQVGFPESDTENEKNAMRHMAMLVGAVVIARASDTKTAKKVLAACRARH
jgi:TetR/AcrR family transcriptional repressor of nem operon